ncbi:MAG: metal ABC transporter permease, partial [Luteolibacter sp.]
AAPAIDRSLMNWTSYDWWIVATGGLCAIACALPGCFLVLRRMSMMGDAISHAVLPGLAIGYLASGSRDSSIMFGAAALTGVLTAFFTQWISRCGNVDRGAAMGVVFTTLFAVGLLLLVRAADRVDLDPGCVLYGSIELVPLDYSLIFGFEVPRAFRVLAIVFAMNAILLVALFKEMKISSFDPALGDTLGFSSNILHYLLMTMVAVTAVAAFESLGSILVIAMLICPAATARLLSQNLIQMILIAALVAMISAPIGHLGAVLIPQWLGLGTSTSTSGMMAVASGVLFLIAWIFSPQQGLLVRWLRPSS